ncbi:class I SAM-dependent methyltransferase [Tundrisphaera sp. TA3]|uniref:class I SAM-dependent methyltransferase n=1 Tax=Tundrisphaera sp. TA3 TaxID=3435775 RepID=UPI003EB8AB71
MRLGRTNVLETPGGPVPLLDYRLTQGGRAWTVAHAGVSLSFGDEQQAITRKEGGVPYGVNLWPSAIGLAHEIASRESDFRGRSVLELGAGTGLPGIVAASLGAFVVQTDHEGGVLDLCRRNGERNGVAIEHRRADWTRWDDARRYDWVIGADILYVEEFHPQLRRIFEANAGGRVLLADPFRKMSLRLLEALESEGWGITVSQWDVGETLIPRPIGVFELRPPRG